MNASNIFLTYIHTLYSDDVSWNKFNAKKVEMGSKERLGEGIYTVPACTHTQAHIAHTFPVAGINKEAFKTKTGKHIYY